MVNWPTVALLPLRSSTPLGPTTTVFTATFTRSRAGICPLCDRSTRALLSNDGALLACSPITSEPPMADRPLLLLSSSVPYCTKVVPV